LTLGSALAGHSQPDHDLRQIGSAVLGVAVAAQPTLRRLLAGGLFGVAFEVGAGGVEEQQVDLEVEQVRDGEEHRFLHLRLRVGLDEQVHRPIRLVLIHRSQPGDGGVVAGPLGRGELGARVDRAVGDQREQHPLHIGGEPSLPQHLAQRRVDTELAPQPVEQPHRAERPGIGDRQAVADRLPHIARGGVGFAEVAVDRGDQPAQPVRVELVLPAQVQQHLRLRHAVLAVVVRELDVADHAAVRVAP
jgi:hypothetical protein